MHNTENHSKRLILKATSDQDPEDELHHFSWESDWSFQGQILADHDNQIPFELIWITPDEATGIHYIEDYVVGFPYLVVDGENIEETVSSIKSSLDVFSVEEIFQWLETATDPEEQAKAIFHLGVAATQEFDSKIFDTFQKVFSNPDSTVRIAAIKACAYLGWHEFREILEHLKTGDQDENVRIKANIMLEAFESQGIT